MANVAMMGILPTPSYQHQQPPSSPSTSMQQQQQHSQQPQQNEERPRILPPPSYRHRQPPPPSASTKSSSQQGQGHHRQGTNDSLATASKHNTSSVPQTAGTVSTIASAPHISATGGGAGDNQSPRQSSGLNYMHRPPAILPNYGKKSRGSVLPKSNVSRVLLYDNITQQTMLDVRMNSIRSQSYKTNRELDMHMKSFISRRKIREKALKKITRVQHMDDYVNFMQEQEQESSSPTFPGIGSHKSGNKKFVTGAKSLVNLYTRVSGNKRARGTAHSTPVEGNTPVSNFGFVGTTEENSLPRINVSSESDMKLKHEILQDKIKHDNAPLPRIVIPSTTENETEHDGNNDGDDDNDKSRKVGVRFVQGDKGVTRVFNIVTEDTDIPTPVKSPRDEKRSQHKPTVSFIDEPAIQEKPDENNNSPSTPDNNQPTPKNEKPPHLQPRKSIFQIQKEKEQEEELQNLKDRERTKSSLSDIPLDLHPEQPTIDSRFLHLRRLLVPQEPPNEGFAELSPSFPKRYPSFKDLSPRSRRKKYEKQKRKSERKIDDSDSGGDSDFLTDSSDDEGN